ncbi:hypothetical protein ABPG72_002327 [Tetrahymena utriculariae]
MCSLQLFHTNPAASSINLILTLVITYIQSVHEYDDRFVRYDYLSMRSSWQRNISTVFEFISLLCYVYLDGNKLLAFTIIFYLILLLLEIYYVPIYNEQIQVLNFFGFIFNILSNINAYFILNTSFQKIYLFGLFIFIPLCFTIAKNSINMRIKQICIQQVSKNSIKNKSSESKFSKQQQNYLSQRKLDELDIYLRNIYSSCKLNYDEYLSSYSSLYLENIIQNHKQYCKNYPYCFCSEEINSQEQRESTNIRSQYLYNYIEIIYQQTVYENSKKQLCNLIFSYLMFVIEVQKNETKAITIALDYLQNKQNMMTHLQQQRLFYVINYLSQKVEFFKTQNQITNKNNDMQLDFIESINYDSDMKKCCILFQQCLLIKKVALQKISMNNIDLLEIESTFSHLREKREELQSLLSHLINRYHKSYILYFLIESFEKSLQCDESLSKQLDREKNLIYTAMNLVQQKKKLTMYSEDSCVIFITLLTNIGIVKKVTKNIYDVVPLLKSNEVIGKNINYMMNQKISAVHNNILQNFIESHNVDFQIKNYPVLIGIDNQGWAIPYKMKMQTCLIGMSDFGASCWVKQIKDTTLYMQISYNNNFEILTISQSIYQYILKDVVPQNRIQKVKIGSLMPTLEHFIKKRYSTSYNYYESIFLKPTNEDFCYNDNNFKKESNLIINIFEMEIYRIRADFYTITHSCIELVQVVISCLEPISEFQFKVEAARQLLYDFEYFQAYDYEFIDNQKLLLQNYIIQTNINRRHMHINNFYEEQSNQRINELSQSSFEECQHESGKQMTNKDTNEEQHQKSQIAMQGISKRRHSKLDQNEQIHNQLANQHQKYSLMDLDKAEFHKKQKTKQSLREITLNRLSNKLEQNILSSIHIQENDSNQDALSPHNITSQFQILYPTVFQSGNDLLNSPSAQSNPNIKDLAYSPQTRHMLQMSTHQSKLDSFDSNQIQDLASFNKRNGQSTTYQQQLSKMSSEHSSKRISSRTQDRNSQQDNPILSNKNLIAKQKTSFFFNQLVQKQQSVSSQNYFDEHSHKLSKINFDRTNSKKSFKNSNEGSVNLSAKTGDSKKKQKLILELRKPNKMTVLKSIQYFGFLTLLVMIIENLVNFVQLDNYLSNQKHDYENQDWACRIQVLLTQILGTQGIVNMVRRSPQYLQVSENKVQLTADIKSQQQQQLQLLSNILLEYQDNKVVSNLGKIIQEETYSLTFAFNATRTIQTPFKIDYSLKIMLGYLYYVAYNQGFIQANTLQLQINLIQLSKQLDIVDDKIQEAILSTFYNIQTSLTRQQIVDIVVASFFSLFFIPIYMYVQKKRQDILVLLSTFGPDKIQMMIDTVLQCELGLEKLGKVFSQSSSDKQHKIQNQRYAYEHFINIGGQKSIPIEKKKNISSTTKLPIFKMSLIFYATIFILVNVIYSFGMGFALIPFIDNQISNLEYTNEVYTIHQFISTLLAYRMQTIQTSNNNQSAIYQMYSQENNVQVQNITNQLNHFYEVINKQSSISRYEGDKFYNFNKNLMQNDSCTEAQNNIQYLQSQGFNQTLCDSIANGVFQQGMINSIKYFSELIKSTDSMLQIQNRTLFQITVSNHFKQYSLSQYFYYQAYESYFVEIVREFVKQVTLNHYDYYSILNISLMIFQIFSFCISITFIYVKFFNDCYNSILATKKLLDVIGIQYLRDNQYVISYFKSL